MKKYSNDSLLKLIGVQNNHETNRLTIIDICESIRDKEITIPLYQRDLSWQPQKSVDLFEYQLRGRAPVAPVSLNNLIDKGKKVPQIEFISRLPIEDIEIVKYSVVDGQQRLTTNYKAFINHESFEDIVFDLIKGHFLHIKKNELKKHQIQVGILLNSDEEVFDEHIKIRKFHKDDVKNLRNIRRKIHTYMYTVHIGKDLDLEQQIEWFQKLNNAGSKVTAIQMALCKLKIIGYDIYLKYIHPYQKLLREYGLYENLITPLTTKESYPIAALNPAYEVLFCNGNHLSNYAPIASDANKKFLEKYSELEMQQQQELNFSDNNSIQEITELTNLALKALKVVLNFLEESGLIVIIREKKRIEYIQFLMGYVIFKNIEAFNKEQSEYISNWINTTNFIDLSNTDKRNIYTLLLGFTVTKNSDELS